MARVELTPRAEEDVRRIWRVIAVQNEAAADALLLRIFEKLELAASQPSMGVARPELGPEARILIEGNYIVIYEPSAYGILTIAVVHGMRDPANWLD